LELFQQCGMFCFSIKFWNCSQCGIFVFHFIIGRLKLIICLLVPEELIHINTNYRCSTFNYIHVITSDLEYPL
jgi:hypothetical protein